MRSTNATSKWIAVPHSQPIWIASFGWKQNIKFTCRPQHGPKFGFLRRGINQAEGDVNTYSDPRCPSASLMCHSSWAVVCSAPPATGALALVVSLVLQSPHRTAGTRSSTIKISQNLFGRRCGAVRNGSSTNHAHWTWSLGFVVVVAFLSRNCTHNTLNGHLQRSRTQCNPQWTSATSAILIAFSTNPVELHTLFGPSLL